ncbi:hypothetical protein [Streptomyces sp. NRRL S-350]|uniref:hypothetical protein n=1 Tax=Streptomyces sp. NRRL S-350 TaxID=1463902 RepID=UPI0004C023D4|nr:hypothetical protein [Streptomyces sp. NRRL S-350]
MEQDSLTIGSMAAGFERGLEGLLDLLDETERHDPFVIGYRSALPDGQTWDPLPDVEHVASLSAAAEARLEGTGKARELLRLGYEAALLDGIGVPKAVPVHDAWRMGWRAAHVALAPAAWKKGVGPCLREAEAEKILGGGAPAALAKGGELIALQGPAHTALYPAWQFTEDGVHPLVGYILRAFERFDVRNDLTLAAWMNTPVKPERAYSPADLLTEGKEEALMELVMEASERWGQ